MIFHTIALTREKIYEFYTSYNMKDKKDVAEWLYIPEASIVSFECHLHDTSKKEGC